MSFLQRNEYLLVEIDHYHNQIKSRLAHDAWSDNYRAVWDAVCHRLAWHGFAEQGGRQMKLVDRLLSGTRHGRVWPFESPVLSGDLSLADPDAWLVKTLFDFQMYTSVQGAGETLAHGMHQLPETLAVLRLLPYLESFVDIGADSGYFSFLAAQHGLPVTAVEPSPTAFYNLRNGIELNGYVNTAAVPCSVSETADGAMLYLDRGGMVKTLDLTDYRAALSLVKISVPGAELQLIHGAGEWLSAYDAPVLLLEIRPSSPLAGKNSHQAVVGALENLDYSVFAINDDISHGGRLLTQVRTGMVVRQGSSCLALPPMSKDLADPLARPVDMRVFTPTVKLENLHHFVKSSFEGL